ncbi:hypothetical protein N9B94_03315 [Verrucomicrobia bacterium]|nr:hypothetical protein [Verrucomicrobiota bacterium]
MKSDGVDHFTIPVYLDGSDSKITGVNIYVFNKGGEDIHINWGLYPEDVGSVFEEFRITEFDVRPSFPFEKKETVWGRGVSPRVKRHTIAAGKYASFSVVFDVVDLERVSQDSFVRISMVFVDSRLGKRLLEFRGRKHLQDPPPGN